MTLFSANVARTQFRFFVLILGLLITPQLIRAQSDDFALNLNSQWKLTHPYITTPFTITVAEDSIVGGSRRVTLDFEFAPYKFQYVLIAKPDGLYIEGVQMAGNMMRLPQPAMFFPKSAAAGQTIETSYGAVTVVSNSVVVADRNGVGRSSRHYRIRWGADRTEDWYMAPGFGPVQYQEGDGALIYSAGTAKPLANRTPPPYRASVCPPLGMMVNPIATDGYSEQFLENKVKQLVPLGSNLITIDAPWAVLEPRARVYDFSDVIRHINWAKTYNMKVLVVVRTVDTLALSLPPDLQGRALNNAAVLSRFKAMLTKLAPALAGRANYIELANEVDPYFQAHPEAIPAFKQFFNLGYTTMKALLPSASVGLVHAYQSTRSNNSVFLQLGALGDHVAFSYYPIGTDFRPMNMELIQMDFDDMLKAAGSRKLMLTESGFPSSTAVGSSQQTQDAYFRALYQFIKNAGERLAGVNLFVMNDISTAVSAGVAGYYKETSTSPFVDFMSSLGFFDQMGVPKLSWSTFVTQAPALTGNACQTTLP